MLRGTAGWGASPTFSGLTLTGQMLASDGSASAPSYSFSSDPDTGIYSVLGNILGFASNTAYIGEINQTGMQVSSTAAFAFGSAGAGSTADVLLVRDAANTLAQRNGTSAQEYRNYGTFTSTSDYHRSAWKQAKSTLSGVSGATVTATNLIPDGAFLLGVTTRINTGLGTSNGTTGYAVGDGVDANMWGDVVGTTAGTASGSSGFTVVGAASLYIAANSVVLTAATGNFDGTGVIEVIAHYMITEAT